MDDVKPEITPALKKIIDISAREIGKELAGEGFFPKNIQVSGNLSSSIDQDTQRKWNTHFQSMGEDSPHHKNLIKAITESPSLLDQLNKAADAGQLSAIRYSLKSQDNDTGLKVNNNNNNKSITITDATKVDKLAENLGYQLHFLTNSAEIAKNDAKFIEGVKKVLVEQNSSGVRDYTQVITGKENADSKFETAARMQGLDARASYEKYHTPNNFASPAQRTQDDSNNQSNAKSRILRSLARIAVIEENARKLVESTKPPKAMAGAELSAKTPNAMAATELSRKTPNALAGTELDGYNPNATVVINIRELGLEKVDIKITIDNSGIKLEFEDRSKNKTPLKVTLDNKPNQSYQSISVAGNSKEPASSATLPTQIRAPITAAPIRAPALTTAPSKQHRLYRS